MSEGHGQAAVEEDIERAGLLREVRRSFDELDDPVQGRGLSLAECLMSGLAVFGLKYPSLLQFERDARTDEVVRANLRSLYGIERAPSDTALRERLDEVDPRQLRGVFKRVFALVQRGKGLEGFTSLDGHYLLSVDGTGYFSSSRVHCAGCCEKHHRDGRTTYYHQMLGAVLVHPQRREVFALAAEPIVKDDGATKNDCERNAAKRLLGDVRREHPHLKLVVVEDGLASNEPHIKQLKQLDMRFILGAKRSDHKALFEWVEATERLNASAVKQVEHTDEQGVHHRIRYLNGVPLNDTHFDLEVSFLVYWETRPHGRKQHFAWVTDLSIEDANAMALMRAGRARWRIENETFNTLKTQRLSLRAQLRSRPQASGDGVRSPDDVGVPPRPGPAALLHPVPEGAAQGRARALLLEQGTGAVPGRRVRGLGRRSTGPSPLGITARRLWSMTPRNRGGGDRGCDEQGGQGTRQRRSQQGATRRGGRLPDRSRHLRPQRLQPAMRNDEPRQRELLPRHLHPCSATYRMASSTVR